MSSLRFGRVESPIGPIWVGETDAGVAACSRADSPEPMLAGLSRRFPGVEPVAADVGAAWAKEGSRAPLDLRGFSAFDAAVYRAVAAIPAGETLTYGDVAALVGAPGAGRAAGGAMARCPLFPAVPCHRVVRASDGWSGWGGDVGLKRRLLAAERR
ncbi:MAG: methylated-DNA--[protein]-cysteine S-methyltransferase [Chloroflexi bacterium]|nr:methylated-DNA--[protein]-cysteine S-methyltransferase [Chloroflexota bacterium]